jgi:hypothetical protein
MAQRGGSEATRRHSAAASWHVSAPTPGQTPLRGNRNGWPLSEHSHRLVPVPSSSPSQRMDSFPGPHESSSVQPSTGLTASAMAGTCSRGTRLIWSNRHPASSEPRTAGPHSQAARTTCWVRRGGTQRETWKLSVRQVALHSVGLPALHASSRLRQSRGATAGPASRASAAVWFGSGSAEGLVAAWSCGTGGLPHPPSKADSRQVFASNPTPLTRHSLLGCALSGQSSLTYKKPVRAMVIRRGGGQCHSMGRREGRGTWGRFRDHRFGLV